METEVNIQEALVLAKLAHETENYNASLKWVNHAIRLHQSAARESLDHALTFLDAMLHALTETDLASAHIKV